MRCLLYLRGRQRIPAGMQKSFDVQVSFKNGIDAFAVTRIKETGCIARHVCVILLSTKAVEVCSGVELEDSEQGLKLASAARV